MLHYHEALNSELLLTNLMIFPLLGRSPLPYESAYQSLESDKNVVFQQQSRPTISSEVWDGYKKLWTSRFNDQAFVENILRLLDCADANIFWKSGIGTRDLVFLSQQALARCYRWGKGCSRDFQKAYESECLSAKRLGQTYAIELNFERDSSWRDYWLDRYHQRSGYIGLMRADNFFLQSFKSTKKNDDWMNDFVQGYPQLEAVKDRREAYEWYHQQYDPDLPPSVFQLALQMRLFVYCIGEQCQASDFSQTIGYLFHRTEPIIVKKWPTLMSMIGDAYRNRDLLLKSNGAQAMNIYQRYDDFYSMSQALWLTKPGFRPQMLSKSGEYAIRAAFGFSKTMDLKNFCPVFSDLCVHHTAALMHWLKLFEEAEETQNTASIFGTVWREVCKRHEAEIQQRFKKVSTYCPERPHEDSLTKNGSLDEWSDCVLWQFQLGLEDKRRLNPQWLVALHTPEICTRLSFLNSGVVVRVSDKLCGEVGQIIQLCEDSATGYKYLKRYGYPMYPIEWFQVNDQPIDDTQLKVNHYYMKQTQSWVPVSASVTVEWLPA